MAKKGKIPPQFLKNIKRKKKMNDKEVPSQSFDRMQMHAMTGKKEYAKY